MFADMLGRSCVWRNTLGEMQGFVWNNPWTLWNYPYIIMIGSWNE